MTRSNEIEQLREKIEAAARVADFAGHGWARAALDHVDEFVEAVVEAWDEAHRIADRMEFSAEAAGELAARAAEIAIREAYHRTGQPGPVGWGIEHPEVLPSGSVRVTIGAHAQGIVTIGLHGEVRVRVTGPGRSLLIETATDADPTIIYEANAEPRDYARAIVLAAQALGIDWLDLAVRFPKELGLADSKEFDSYARSRNAGELFGAGAED